MTTDSYGMLAVAEGNISCSVQYAIHRNTNANKMQKQKLIQ